MISDEDLKGISPGVRQLVLNLNRLGYETRDSGDGTNHTAGMACAIPERHVFGVFTGVDRDNLRGAAQLLQLQFPLAYVEVSYSPASELAVWMLFPDGASEGI